MFTQGELISSKYLDMQRALHASPRGYGGRGDKWAGVVMQIAADYQASSILDYGAGQRSLARALKAMPLGSIRVDEYDPAIPDIAYLPTFADLVICTDVLEHIEKDRLDAVLAHLKMLARKAVFVVISTKTSNKVLPDGRNAHLIVRPGAWWKKRLQAAGFTLHNAPTIVRRSDKEWVGVLTP